MSHSPTTTRLTPLANHTAGDRGLADAWPDAGATYLRRTAVALVLALSACGGEAPTFDSSDCEKAFRDADVDAPIHRDGCLVMSMELRTEGKGIHERSAICNACDSSLTVAWEESGHINPVKATPLGSATADELKNAQWLRPQFGLYDADTGLLGIQSCGDTGEPSSLSTTRQERTLEPGEGVLFSGYHDQGADRLWWGPAPRDFEPADGDRIVALWPEARDGGSNHLPAGVCRSVGRPPRLFSPSPGPDNAFGVLTSWTTEMNVVAPGYAPEYASEFDDGGTR